MYQVEAQVRQGDILITPIDSLPKNAKRIEENQDRHIVSHSETGHPHVLEAPPSVVQLFGTSDPMVSYIRVQERPVELRHEKHGPERHGSFELPPGNYELRRQQEMWPDGWRPVVD